MLLIKATLCGLHQPPKIASLVEQVAINTDLLNETSTSFLTQPITVKNLKKYIHYKKLLLVSFPTNYLKANLSRSTEPKPSHLGKISTL